MIVFQPVCKQSSPPECAIRLGLQESSEFRFRKRYMELTRKDLMHLEYEKNSSPLERTLLVCNNGLISKKPQQSKEKPVTTSVPKSHVLGRIKDFLGVISEANERLQLDAKDNSEKFDIEVLSGNGSEVIEMDLMLGVADLHTPEAVAAAQSAIAGYQPVIPLAADDCGSVSEDSSDEDCSSEDPNDDDDDQKNNTRNDNHVKKFSPLNLKRSKFVNGGSSNKNAKSQKRAKIIELS